MNKTIETKAPIELIDKWCLMLGESSRSVFLDIDRLSTSYIGMCRHDFMTSDWIAHDIVYTYFFNSLAEEFGFEKINQLSDQMMADIKETLNCENDTLYRYYLGK